MTETRKLTNSLFCDLNIGILEFIWSLGFGYWNLMYPGPNLMLSLMKQVKNVQSCYFNHQ